MTETAGQSVVQSVNLSAWSSAEAQGQTGSNRRVLSSFSPTEIADLKKNPLLATFLTCFNLHKLRNKISTIIYYVKTKRKMNAE